MRKGRLKYNSDCAREKVSGRKRHLCKWAVVGWGQFESTSIDVLGNLVEWVTMSAKVKSV